MAHFLAFTSVPSQEKLLETCGMESSGFFFAAATLLSASLYLSPSPSV